jgi:hypothetical protein
VKRTSVSLDPETAEIADRIGNFSAFVRDCLRRWNAYDLGIHLQPERAEIDLGKKCFPRHKKGCCKLCWPDGPPSHDDWSYYVQSGGKVVVGKRMDDSPIYETRKYNNEWIEEKARSHNHIPQFPISQESSFNYHRKGASKQGGKGYLARLWILVRGRKSK